MILRTALVALSLAAATPAAGARAPRRVVVVPFENAARMPSARDVVMPAVEAALGKKGYEVVTGGPVQQFLRARRIRFLDSLTVKDARELAEQLGADAVVVGTILAYGGPQVDPQVGIAVRILPRDGAAWSNLVALSGADTEGALGRGRARTPKELVPRVVSELLGSSADLRPRRRVLSSASLGGAPRVFRARDWIGKPLTVCVLPLENLTDDRDAPRVVDAALLHHLSTHAALTPVQPSQMRAGLVASGLGPPAHLSAEGLAVLAKEVGTALFLRGTIMAYGASNTTGDGPTVEIYLNLFDVESGRIVWSGLHRRTGREYEGLLRFGAVHDGVSLSNRVVMELLDAFTRS
jgi:hypothetical protein